MGCRQSLRGFAPSSVCGGVKPVTRRCLCTVLVYCRRTVIIMSSGNCVNLRLTGRGLQGKGTAAFDHHECWVRRRPLGSHCSDLPGGKQGCQFDSSLAFSKLIRYRVYTGTPAGASVLHLLRAWSVAQSHPARIISSFFFIFVQRGLLVRKAAFIQVNLTG